MDPVQIEKFVSLVDDFLAHLPSVYEHRGILSIDYGAGATPDRLCGVASARRSDAAFEREWEHATTGLLESGRGLGSQLDKEDGVILNKFRRLVEVRDRSGMKALWHELRAWLTRFAETSERECIKESDNPYDKISVDLDHDTVTLGTVVYPVTPAQAYAVDKLVAGHGGWVKSLNLKEDRNTRVDRVIARLPKPIHDRITPKRGGGGGYRLA